MNSSNSNDNKEQVDKTKALKRGSLKANFVFNFISQILALIIPLITTPYLARVLGADVNGQISFSTSIISYFTLAANFGFSLYGQREIAKYQDDEYQRSKAFEEIFILRFIFTVISATVLLSLIFSNVFNEKYHLFLLIQALNVISCAFDPSFYYQGAEDFKSLAIKTVVVRIVCMVVIFVFVKSASDAWIYVLANSASTFLSCIIMVPGVIATTRFIQFRELNIWKRIWPAFLIFLPNLAMTIYSVLDKTMIGILATNADYENGCYEQAYKINGIILLLVTFSSITMASRNSNDFTNGNIDSFNKHLNFQVNYIWLLGIPLIVGCAVMAPSLSYWYLGEEYKEVPILLQIMSVRFLVSGFYELFGTQLFIAIGKEKYVTIATTIGAIVDFSLNYFLIKWQGALGAAISTAVCEVVVCSILGVIAFKQGFFHPSSFFKPMIKPLISAGIMFVPIYFMNKYFSYSVWTFMMIVLVGIIVYMVSLLVLRDDFFITLIKKANSTVKKFISKKKGKQ